MKQILVTILDIIIDILLQGSLILYYFMGNHSFILENIVKFIPVFLFLRILIQILALIGVCAAKIYLDDKDFLKSINTTKEDAQKVIDSFSKDKNILHRIWNIITDITFGLLIILTGHPFCFIMFLIIKGIYSLSKNIAKKG